MEKNKTRCKNCKELKDRIQDGTYPNGKNKKWRDELGRLWSGKTCGECNQIRVKEAMKKTRNMKKNVGMA